MGIIAFIIFAAFVALPIHLLVIRGLNRSRNIDVRDFLWTIESVLLIIITSLSVGFVAGLLVLAFLALRDGHLDEFAPLILLFGPCYAFPGAVLVGVIAHLVWRKRRISGRCTQCGYDLTGNTSGVCPECGQPASL
ncbi:MAG: hypothetical protein H6817_09650 [Phycisphaerales bacterium]|nr:hypothetical protein [Phycisphaerales bacterium]